MNTATADEIRMLFRIAPRGSDPRLLGLVEDSPVVLGAAMRDGIQVLKLGGAAAGFVAPGPTIEELVASMVPIGTKTGDALAKVPMDQVLAIEEQRCLNWLGAERDLALALLMGPVANRQRYHLNTRRRDGNLCSDGSISDSGLWRLAFESGQGIGGVERRRRILLRWHGRRSGLGMRSRGDRRNHLVAVQGLVFKLLERDSRLVPLGIEHSMVMDVVRAKLRAILGTEMRADALLGRQDNSDREGRLVWVEVQRRPVKRLSEAYQRRYERLRTEALGAVATQLQRPVELVFKQGGTTEHLLYLPQRGGPTGTDGEQRFADRELAPAAPPPPM